MEKNKKSNCDKLKYSDNAYFEKKYWGSQAYLCGIDEVGRGSLIGPIVTAAVILKPFKTHKLLVDSKILSEKKRVEATEWILNNSWYAFGMASHQEINTLGIYQATQIAMKRAFYLLLSQPETPQPSKVLIDAMPLDLSNHTLQQLDVDSFPYGESRSISIAAASIIAKTYRDNLMNRLHTTYSGYGLNKNKGYGTQDHTIKIQHQGATLIHRTLFIKKIIQGTYNESVKAKQSSIFC